MKGLTTEQRIEAGTKNINELLNYVLEARCGGILEFDYIQELVLNIQKDEIDLISIIADMEYERDKPKEIDIPKFMLVKGA